MIGILSDAHGNGPAFNQTIEILREAGATRFIFLGDAVGYLCSTEVVLKLISLTSQVLCIQGNHESMLLSGEIDLSRDEIYKLSLIRKNLHKEEINFLSSWPLSRTESFNDLSVLFIHGSPADYLNGYVYPDTDLAQFEESYDVVFMGHSHYPFIRKHGKVCYVNVGSCGMPRDDGRFGSAAIFDPITGIVKILRYDITAATNKALLDNPIVHTAVKANFDRRRDSIYGDLIK
jgi:putative phosphoesterase